MPDATPAVLSGRTLEVALGGRAVLSGVTVEVARGTVTALCGPNGSGKSTLLRTLCGLLRPGSGTVLLEGVEISRLRARSIARRVAFLPQSSEAPSGITVRDLVGYGRHPHRGPFDGLLGTAGREDVAAVDWAMEATGLAHKAEHAVDALSGGERQRAWIAMALAQRTDLLLLDEPTTYLDIRHQVEVLELIRGLNRRHGLTVVWVLHDLNQAAAYSDRIFLLKQGRIAHEGTPAQIARPDIVSDVFGLRVVLARHPETAAPLFVPSAGPADGPPVGQASGQAEPRA